MSITVKKIALPEQIKQETPIEENRPLVDNYLNLVGAVEVECQIRVGTLTLTIAELSQLKQGQILPLHQKTHEPIDIVLNNQIIAHGELMAAEDHFAIRITEIAS
ncbi:FliM/FliN family flagellar motor switch protein [Legionella fairfieldensis]|uniref:FliM/FliN family flagellar motor switch protein n=1 Tax=Legionella fairfieldensis TaxID=45064 RepID=UPI00048E7410|nr:FliM/FliN family flagellar motor switch protein [Legionella fairfieldensis]